MKTMMHVLISLMLALNLAQGAAFEKEVKSENKIVLISSEKPLSVGSNTLILSLSEEGQALEGTGVEVKAFMPAMPGMPAMKSVAKAIDRGNGKYEVKLNLAMNGTWQLHIFIRPVEGKKARVKTSLSF